MKKRMTFLVVLIFTFFVSLPVQGAEQTTPGMSEQKQQMQMRPPGTPPPDFKVEGVRILETETGQVATGGVLSSYGNYTLSCMISYSGPKSATPPCAGIGASAVVVLKVDGNTILNLNSGCLAPGQEKIFNSQGNQTFTIGSHTYECVITETSLTDSNSANNTKSMTYQVKK